MNEIISLCEKCARYEHCIFFDTEATECNIYQPPLTNADKFEEVFGMNIENVTDDFWKEIYTED